MVEGKKYLQERCRGVEIDLILELVSAFLA